MTDDVSEDQFEEAITQAKTERNLSRANVLRKIVAPDEPPTFKSRAAIEARRERMLRSDADSVARERKLVEPLLQHLPGPVGQCLELVVSELATNAVRSGQLTQTTGRRPLNPRFETSRRWEPCAQRDRGGAMAGEPFQMLEQDHRQVARMLKELSDSEPGPERQAMVDRLTAAFSVHASFEESNVYPLVAQVMGEETEAEAEVEHGLAREGLAKLVEMVDAPGFGAAVAMLESGITHHVDEEETEIFPKLQSAVDSATKDQLVEALRSAKASAGLPVVDPDSATKEELLQAAADAGIEGRSSMTKDELAQALTRTPG